MAGSIVTIASDFLTATISDQGAELQSLSTADGCEMLWDGDPEFWTGRAPILFPVIGMLNGGQYRFGGQIYKMAKHGFARHSRFEIVDRTGTAVTMRLAASDATRSLYPFDFALDVTFRVDAATLLVSAAIANRSSTTMPASFGFHPAFRWPLPFGGERDAHRLAFDREEPEPVRRIGGDGLLLPTGEASPVAGRELALRDELFQADALIFDAVHSRSVNYGVPHQQQLRVTFPDFPILGLWTKPSAGFICIEPWSGLPDPVGFNGDLTDKPGMMLIAPHQTRTLAMAISVTGRGA